MAGIYILGLEMPKNGAERCIVIHGDGKISTFVGTLVDYAKAIPADDVVEREPGVWTEIHTVCDKGYGQVYYQHTACSTEIFKSPYDYCPRCGCKMGRKDGDGE